MKQVFRHAPRPLRSAAKSVRNVVGLGLSGMERSMYHLGLRSYHGLQLPDFLGIGVPKAGTTWLYENLRHHPDLYLGESKELHYFGSGYWHRLKYYSRSFEEAGERLKGEITPNYCLLGLRRIKAVHRIIPDVRLILLLREPCARAWSHAKYKVAHHTGRAVDEVPLEEFVTHLNSEGALRRGAYRQVIEDWISVFPPEQLFVGFYEDLRSRPRDILADVFRHIGVTTDVDWDTIPFDKTVKRGPAGDIPRELRSLITQLYGGESELLQDRYEGRVAQWRVEGL